MVDAEERALLLVPPELDPGSDFAFELGARHVGLVPAIGRDCTAIACGRRIHDCEYHGAFCYAAEANRAHVARHLDGMLTRDVASL